MRTISDETRRKMSESAKRRCEDPKWLETQHNRGTKLPKDIVILMYDGGSTQQEIADVLNVSQKVVWRFMKNNGITARKAAKREQSGENNSYWKGGRRIDDQGYVEIYKPNSEHVRSNGYVREHVYVAEKMLGRRLIYYKIGDPRNEVVHHIDGNKQNNDPSNLLILTQSQHMRIHKAIQKQIVDEALLERIRQLEEEIRAFA